MCRRILYAWATMPIYFVIPRHTAPRRSAAQACRSEKRAAGQWLGNDHREGSQSTSTPGLRSGTISLFSQQMPVGLKAYLAPTDTQTHMQTRARPVCMQRHTETISSCCSLYTLLLLLLPH